MAEIANWGKHKFIVSPSVIQSFRDMTIKASCETKDKTSDNQKYVERKSGEATTITFTVELNALTGVQDVYGEAQLFRQEASEGATEYFYLGPSKIIPAKVMLTSAEISQIVYAPGKGNVWISCDVKLTMKQASATEGSGGGSGSGSGSGSGGGVRIYYCNTSGEVKYVSGATEAKARENMPRSGVLWASQSKSEADAWAAKYAQKKAEAAQKEGQNASKDKTLGKGTEKMNRIAERNAMEEP